MDEPVRIVCDDVGAEKVSHGQVVVDEEHTAQIDCHACYKRSREESWTWSPSDFYLQPEDRSDAWTVDIDIVFSKRGPLSDLLPGKVGDKPAREMVKVMWAGLEKVDERFRKAALLNTCRWSYTEIPGNPLEWAFLGRICASLTGKRPDLTVTLSQLTR